MIGDLDIGILCSYNGVDIQETQGNIRLYLHNSGYEVPDGRNPSDCIANTLKKKYNNYGYEAVVKYL